MTTRTTLVRTFLCPSDNKPNRTPTDIVLTSYAACHNGLEAPIDASNDGVFILNRAIRYEDIPDGSSNTIFVGEKRLDGTGQGWASGTRASLRNTGTAVNAVVVVPLPGKAAAPPAVEDSADFTPNAAVPGTPGYVGGYASNHPGGATPPWATARSGS